MALINDVNAAQKQSIDGRGAVTPSGHYMGIDREIFAVGANILDSDWVFTGQVVTMQEAGPG